MNLGYVLLSTTSDDCPHRKEGETKTNNKIHTEERKENLKGKKKAISDNKI